MSGWQVAALVVGILVFEGVLLALVLRAVVSSTFGVLERKHPVVTPSPDAVCRSFQSMSFGLTNFGLCVHMATDESGLHLMPAALLRWGGARGVTIPWTHVELMPHRGRGRFVPCRLSGLRARIPAWCLEVVA